MRYVIAAVFLALLGIVGFLLSDRSASPEVLHDAATVYRDNHQTSAVPTPCPYGRPVLLIIGQSNAANYGDGRRASNAANFYRGRCYRAQDPLLGSSGDRGSVWTRLPFRGVVAPVAIGGTFMEEWAPGGRLFARIEMALIQLQQAQLKPTHIIVLQGESDGQARSDPLIYQRNAVRLLTFLKATGAKVYFATSSGCGERNEEIRAAQQRARHATGALAGPDIDAYKIRINRCHLDNAALSKLAREWSMLLGL